MDNAARVRQRLLAISLPIAAVLYIAAEGLNPKGTDQPILTMTTAFKVLPIAARHPGQLYVSGSLTILALGALAVSYGAIAALARNRGSAVATVAALIGGLGASAATARMTQGTAARFLVTTFHSGFATAFLYAYFIGIVAAPVIMGVALWRSRSVPRWLAVLFTVSLEVAQQVQSKGIAVVLLYTLAFAVAMALLAARIWQAAARPAGRDIEQALAAQL